MAKYLMSERTAAWVRSQMERRAPASAAGVTRGVSSSFAVEDEFAYPYAVQWAQSVNSGEGGWIIWLPGDALLVVDGQAVDVRNGLEAAGGDYPDGWYLLGGVIEGNGTLNLDIHFPDPDASATDAPTEIYATFSDGKDAEGGESSQTINVKICDISTDADTGARSVRQYVTSMIIVGGGEETYISGDGEGSEWLEVAGKKIVIQGYPGDGDGAAELGNCGLTFTAVGPRVGENGEKIPAKIIVGVKGKRSDESWAAKEMKIPLAGGGTKLVHFLGCDNVDLTNIGDGGGSGGGGESGGSGDVVASLNGEKGDLVLRLLEGWLEIVKGGQAVKAVGTVATSVSGLVGDLAVIGGNKIKVEREGNSLRISYDDEKGTGDANPFPDSGPEACEHPGGGGGEPSGDDGGDSGGESGGGVQGGGGESGGGDSCCGGGSAAGGSATGAPEPGVSGKPATGGSGAIGVEITGTQTPEGGKEASGGLFNGSTIPKKKLEGTKTHGSLTDTKKMNTSPFAKDPNWHGSIEDTAENSKKPIYAGTHSALTDTKKMNESPFKRK